MSPPDFKDVKIAVIGGSGLYHLDNLTHIANVFPNTPWGFPSSEILICETPSKTKIAFLARHGKGHVYNPSEIPNRANIAALKSIGVEVIVAFSAAIDRTKGIRPSTFFENGFAAHAMFGDPFHVPLVRLLSNHADILQNCTLHTDKTLVCMEGPAFSTRAESNLYRTWGADIINMSAIPESKLAREAEIAYAMVCMSTDYDAWREDEEAVTVETVMENLHANSENAKRMVLSIIPDLEKVVKEDSFNGKSFWNGLKGSMKFACITSKEKRNPETEAKIDYLLRGYF
ncbi:nucleoside phosphorylase domain-containing protein [Paraphysoderma sedebokerense]|nr:nucleoside phosphorylase domain-containing protein [Paraphysoderma sedebokerense]